MLAKLVKINSAPLVVELQIQDLMQYCLILQSIYEENFWVLPTHCNQTTRSCNISDNLNVKLTNSRQFSKEK